VSHYESDGAHAVQGILNSHGHLEVGRYCIQDFGSLRGYRAPELMDSWDLDFHDLANRSLGDDICLRLRSGGMLPSPGVLEKRFEAVTGQFDS
jgi:hypothetical protein